MATNLDVRSVGDRRPPWTGRRSSTHAQLETSHAGSRTQTEGGVRASLRQPRSRGRPDGRLTKYGTRADFTGKQWFHTTRRPAVTLKPCAGPVVLSALDLTCINARTCPTRGGMRAPRDGWYCRRALARFRSKREASKRRGRHQARGHPLPSAQDKQARKWQAWGNVRGGRVPHRRHRDRSATRTSARARRQDQMAISDLLVEVGHPNRARCDAKGATSDGAGDAPRPTAAG